MSCSVSESSTSGTGLPTCLEYSAGGHVGSGLSFDVQKEEECELSEKAVVIVELDTIMLLVRIHGG